jgi:NTP pyrophosphatase (non-canonical NTP hydrolase)
MLKGLINIVKIWMWHKKTFPEFTAINQKKKVRDEAHELVEAFKNFIQNGNCARQKHVEEELADVIIASVNAMRFEDVRREVNKKMKENHKRSWKNGQHKR